MTFRDTFNLALRNLGQAKLRTTLTTLGVSIGIASLAGMVSLGVGLQDQVVGRFLQSGVFDSVTVTSPGLLGAPGAFIANGGRGGLRGQFGGRGRGENQTPPPKLDDAALKELAAVENVREVYPTFRIPVELTLGDFSRPMSVSGAPMSSKGEGAFQTLAYGQFFSNESDRTCLFGLNMAKQIEEKDPGSLIGKTATLAYAATRENQIQRVNLDCRIVGIVERDPGALPIPGGPGVSVVVPLALAKTIDAESVPLQDILLANPSQQKSYNLVTVKVKDAKFTQDVEDRIRKMGFTVFSVNDALRGAKNAFILFDIVLSLIGSIALAVSSLGIVNTMVMSILERTREIGIMKAIGADDEHIRRIFLIEASAIGILGGFLGVALGWLVGRIINFGANLYIQSQGGTPGTLFSLPVWLIASAIAFSVTVSLIAGSYPAARAARLDPIQALRHD
ncbi:MAG TPA: ABC transporter permease [Terriglobia bacterium]|nr:ABC transporter permease [Terriglobia bacterium]